MTVVRVRQNSWTIHWRNSGFRRQEQNRWSSLFPHSPPPKVVTWVWRQQSDFWLRHWELAHSANLPNSLVWSSVIKYLGEAVLRPRLQLSGATAPSVPLVKPLEAYLRSEDQRSKIKWTEIGVSYPMVFPTVKQSLAYYHLMSNIQT